MRQRAPEHQPRGSRQAHGRSRVSTRPARATVRAAMTVMAMSLVAGGCAREGPTRPPGSYAIRGHVKLTGYLVDAGGIFAGTRVVGDADGVVVELLYGRQVVGQATTVDGVYTFTGVGPGGYQTRTHLIGSVGDVSEDLTVVTHDLDVADTLRLVSVGDLRPVPNPIATYTPIFFTVPDTQWVEIEILDLAGRLIRVLAADPYDPGDWAVFWDGMAQGGVPAPAPIYWVTYASDDGIRAHLLFR